jgi:hypothetical protein
VKAVSFLQPWGWLVAEGKKRIENRKQNTKHRGPFMVHISQQTPQKYYDDARRWLDAHHLGDVVVPPLNELPRGGFIGTSSIVDVRPPAEEFGQLITENPDSLDWRWWMTEQYGYVLGEAKRCKFIEWPGNLGFWDVPDRVVKRCRIVS